MRLQPSPVKLAHGIRAEVDDIHPAQVEGVPGAVIDKESAPRAFL